MTFYDYQQQRINDLEKLKTCFPESSSLITHYQEVAKCFLENSAQHQLFVNAISKVVGREVYPADSDMIYTMLSHIIHDRVGERLFSEQRQVSQTEFDSICTMEMEAFVHMSSSEKDAHLLCQSKVQRLHIEYNEAKRKEIQIKIASRSSQEETAD